MLGSIQVLPRARACSLVLMTAFVTMTATLLMTAEVSASQYRWKNDADGSWTTAANWVNIDNDPDGYPNDPGDVVGISTFGATPRVITIPENVTVTIGLMVVSATQNYTIVGQGLGMNRGTLVFNSASAADAQVVMATANGVAGISAPVRLESSLTVNVAPTSRVAFGGISQFMFAHSVTKTGQGTVFFNGHNTYNGTTRVVDGVLELRAAPGVVSIEGTLDVGDGSGAAHSATVVMSNKDQINSPLVNVKRDGWLEFVDDDAIGYLTIDEGTVVLKNDTNVTLGGLNMIGGVLTADVGSNITLGGDVTAIAGAGQPAQITGSASSTLHLPSPRSFNVTEPPPATSLEIGIPVTGGSTSTFTKDGPGILAFTGTFANTYTGVTRVREGTLLLLREVGVAVPGDLEIGGRARPASVRLDRKDNIADTSQVNVAANGSFIVVSVEDSIARLSLTQGQATVSGETARLIVGNRIEMLGGGLLLTSSRVTVDRIVATSSADGPSLIYGSGRVAPRGGEGLTLEVADGPRAIDLTIDASIETLETQGVGKTGAGVARLSARNAGHHGPTAIAEGTLVVTGEPSAEFVRVIKGTLTGNGAVSSVIAEAATIAPGFDGPGTLTTGSLTFAPETTVAIEFSRTNAGAPNDRLVAGGAVTLNNAALSISAGVAPPLGDSFTIIDNDDKDPVDGTFAGLPEGAKLLVQGVELRITYRGGDGNDVVLNTGALYTYFLAEGATGAFFDNDILIANPNTTEAPITLTFLKEDGNTVLQQRTVPARGRLTVHVDEIPELQDVSASTTVTSDSHVPLIVERTMFWDASYYGGHTANALEQPRTRWIFAEGFQGFFDTYVLIANANAEPTSATLTFLRENATPFVTTVPVAAFARKTVYAGDYPELAGRAFGVVVDATQPVIAERAMYFANEPNRLWVGGHVNTGIVAPSTSWFHAEGATGSFFNTFILLSNPQDTEAMVELSFLLDNGTVVTKQKEIAARQRLTINPAIEDGRLTDAALSTVVQSNVPIVSERSMYWAEGGAPFGEGHNSTGVVSPATRWGLAEGRAGGPREFTTYILLANPSAKAADVTVTYLPENGAPIVKNYHVAPTSRYNIDVKAVVPELDGESFGAVIDVTNGVPIAVERSLYWNANGKLWAGGTNALGTPLPAPQP